MAKLYFRYGTVGSAKTLNLLAVAHNYTQQGKNVFLIKPRLDDRFGLNHIRSRAGLERQADLLVTPTTKLDFDQLKNVDCVLADEVQFFSAAMIDQLRRVAGVLKIPVICYGLRTDFRRDLFEGSRRLMEVADTIEEVKTTCAYCNRKAIYNLKLLDGTPTISGPSIDLGAEEKYLPVCHGCYQVKLGASGYASPSASKKKTEVEA